MILLSTKKINVIHLEQYFIYFTKPLKTWHLNLHSPFEAKHSMKTHKLDLYRYVKCYLNGVKNLLG